MMKNIVYIVCFLLCFSCNQYSQKSDNAVATESKELKIGKDGLVDDAERKDLDFKSSDFALENMNVEIEEKLQANYEAKILAVKHPEFEAAIKEQLADSNKFNYILSDSIQSIEVRNLSFYGKQDVKNDSITTQKMKYTSLINSKYSQKDSVLVIIKRSMIMIDNSIKVNTSFSFEKLD